MCSVKTVFFTALIERTFTPFQNIGCQLLDFWHIYRTLLFWQNHPFVVLNAQYTNPFCIAKYGDIGIVRRKQKLATKFSSAKLCNNSFGNKRIVQIVFRRSEERRVGKECRSRWS